MSRCACRVTRSTGQVVNSEAAQHDVLSRFVLSFLRTASYSLLQRPALTTLKISIPILNCTI
eukprot:768448-Hanusia_phi.AAC.6